MSTKLRFTTLLSLVLVAACGGVDRGAGGDHVGHGHEPALSFEEFRAMTFREEATGVFVYNGDTTARDEKELRAIWERDFAAPEGALIVNTVGGADDRWTEVQKKQLTYCVSPGFGTRTQLVVEAMDAAVAAWEATSDIDFQHVTAEDANCNASNENVVFDVSPADGYVSYLARAFFPSYDRARRNVLIADGSFTGSVGLVGILRHELGHVLGFRHEHTRPESGVCFENSEWRPLTPYDQASVMHYPQCNGISSWELAITEEDAAGAANLYGARGGTQPAPQDPTDPDEPTDPNAPVFTGSLAAGKRANHGPIAVVGGRELAVRFEASAADAKMYVRFGSKPTTGTYDAVLNPGETATKRVPSNRRVAHVLVVAKAATAYDVFASMSEAPVQPPAEPSSHTWTGELEAYASVDHGPVPVTAGQTLVVTVDGSGDPDLYVGFGASGLETTACTAYATGADRCSVTVPEGATSAWLTVYGYSATSYTAVATVE